MVKADDLIVDIWEYAEFKQKYEKDSAQVLIEKINKEHDVPKDQEPDYDKIAEMEDALAEKLGLVSQGMLQRWQKDVMENIADEIDDLFAKFRNHRHDYSKTFTGKAEY